MVDLNTIVPPDPVERPMTDQSLAAQGRVYYDLIQQQILSEAYKLNNLSPQKSHRANIDSFMKNMLPLIESSGGTNFGGGAAMGAWQIMPNTWPQVVNDTKKLWERAEHRVPGHKSEDFPRWIHQVNQRGTEKIGKNVNALLAMTHLWESMQDPRQKDNRQRFIQMMQGDKKGALDLYLHGWYRGEEGSAAWTQASKNARRKLLRNEFGIDIETSEGMTETPEDRQALDTLFTNVTGQSVPKPGDMGGMDSQYGVQKKEPVPAEVPFGE